MPTKKKPDPKPATSPRLEVAAPADKSTERLTAELMIEGGPVNAYVTTLFSKGALGDVSLTESVKALDEASAAVKGGSLAAAEGMLVAQAVALNAIFGELSRRAALNMGEYLGAMDTYMRLALKAQAQCRATLETLAAIKNPPVVYARQANISHGPQQVNNGGAGAGATVRADGPAPAANSATAPSELLEQQHGQWLDPRASGAAGGADPRVEALGKVHRPADR
ncbi:MAG: hypothetical protein ABS84_10365 [Rubrivivax sp. SCN 71-131]|nr:MAG: hypothetical protein ABS84_10365 [Rubrivivax sp. SCN 71-131]